MGRLFLLLLLLHLGLAFAAIVDCWGGEEKPRRWSRFVWSLAIVFGLFAGPIAWFTRGRPGAKLGEGWLFPGTSPSEPTRPRTVAPDDDPEFLANLERHLKPDAGHRLPPPHPRLDTDGPAEKPRNDATPDDYNGSS